MLSNTYLTSLFQLKSLILCKNTIRISCLTIFVSFISLYGNAQQFCNVNKYLFCQKHISAKQLLMNAFSILFCSFCLLANFVQIDKCKTQLKTHLSFINTMPKLLLAFSILFLGTINTYGQSEITIGTGSLTGYYPLPGYIECFINS